MVTVVVKKKGQSSVEEVIPLNELCSHSDFFNGMKNGDYKDKLREDEEYTIKLTKLFEGAVSQESALIVLKCLKDNSSSRFCKIYEKLSGKARHVLLQEVSTFVDYYFFETFKGWIENMNPINEHLNRTLCCSEGSFASKIKKFLTTDEEFSRIVFSMICEYTDEEKEVLITQLGIPSKKRNKFKRTTKFEELWNFVNSNPYSEERLLEANPHAARQVENINKELEKIRKVTCEEYYLIFVGNPFLLCRAREHINDYEIGFTGIAPSDDVRQFVNKYEGLVARKNEILKKLSCQARTSTVKKTDIDSIKAQI